MLLNSLVDGLSLRAMARPFAAALALRSGVLAIGLAASGLASTVQAAEAAAPFSFAARTAVATGTLVSSDAVTLSGFTGNLSVTVADSNGGSAGHSQVSINGAAFTTTPGAISAGQTLVVRHLSATSANATRQSVVQVGATAANFQSSTGEADTTPYAFGFGAKGYALPGAMVESDAITPSGFNGALSVVPSFGAQYRITGGTPAVDSGWVNGGVKLLAGQSIATRHRANSSKLAYTRSSLRIGSLAGGFISRTQGAVTGAAFSGGPDALAAPSPRSLVSYLHDLSPKLAGVTSANAVLEHYNIPVSDGTILDGWVRRPPGTVGQPLVLVFSPYYGGGDPSLSPLGDPSSTFASHLIPYGYAVGFVSVGGTGNSGGCFRDGGPIERKQLYDAVEYMAKRSWSNGAVASIGVSYDGTTASELFVAAPPSLKTVVPMEAITDYYRYTFHKGGIPRADTTFFTTYYYPIVGLSAAGLEGGVGPTEPNSYVTELQGEPCPEQLAIQQQSVMTEITADKTPFWQERDAIALINNSLATPRPSMMFIEGLQDGNVDPQMADGFLEAVRKTGVPLKVLFGQWVHAYPQGSTCAAKAPCRGDFWDQALLAWFDQFLKGRNTGILDTPMVQIQGDDGVWRHESAWPVLATETQVFNLQAIGSMGPSAGSGSKSYLDTGSNHYNETNTGRQVAYPQPPGVSVEFVSSTLTAPLRITGIPKLKLAAKADAARANVVVTLLERKSDGTQRFLNFAALNLNHAQSAETSTTDITGLPINATLDFYPQENIVAAGSRLVLHISGDIELTHTTAGNATNFLNLGMNLLPAGIGANVTLDLTKTRLELPVNTQDVKEQISWLP